MAYVALSSVVKADIAWNITKMRDQEKTLHPTPPTKVMDDELRNFVDQHLWGEHHQLKYSIPHNWKRIIQSIKFRAEYVDEATLMGEVVTVTVYNNASLLVGPPAHNDYVLNYYSSTNQADLVIPVAPDFHVVSDLVAHTRLHREIDARWQKVSNDVSIFLDKCKSLNEALKLWPDLRIYVSKEHLERLEEKRNGKKDVSAALAVLSNIDTAGAVSAAVGLTLQRAASMENL